MFTDTDETADCLRCMRTA